MLHADLIPSGPLGAHTTTNNHSVTNHKNTKGSSGTNNQADIYKVYLNYMPQNPPHGNDSAANNTGKISNNHT